MKRFIRLPHLPLALSLALLWFCFVSASWNAIAARSDDKKKVYEHEKFDINTRELLTKFTSKKCSGGKIYQYLPAQNWAGCLDCQRGYTLTLNLTSNTTRCEPCRKGYYFHYYHESGADCLRCAKGRYSDTLAADACTFCSAGRYAPTTNSTGCLDCEYGKYTLETGSTECYPCLRGFEYKLKSGSLGKCVLCPKGRYAPSPGICADCSMGRFTEGKGQRECDRVDTSTEAGAAASKKAYSVATQTVKKCFSEESLVLERQWLVNRTLVERRELICEGKEVGGRKLCDSCIPSTMDGVPTKNLSLEGRSYNSSGYVVFMLEAVGWGNVVEAFSVAWILASYTNRKLLVVLRRQPPKRQISSTIDFEKVTNFLELAVETYPGLQTLVENAFELSDAYHDYASAESFGDVYTVLNASRYVSISVKRQFLKLPLETTSPEYYQLRQDKAGRDLACSRVLRSLLVRSPVSMQSCGINYLSGDIELSSTVGKVLTRLEWQDIDIAIHIRLGNHVLYGRNSSSSDYRLHGIADTPHDFPWKKFFRCIWRHASEMHEAKRIFVASDWDGIFSHAQIVYGHRLVQYPSRGDILLVTDRQNAEKKGNTIDSYREAMVRVLAEHAVLGAAKVTYYPTSSSFSQTAALASLVPQVLYHFRSTKDPWSCPVEFQYQ